MTTQIRCAGCSEEFPYHVVERFGGLCPACVAGFATIDDPVDAPLKAGGTFGKYEILGELGRGGMGTVYRARHTALDRVVALKVLSARLAADPEFVSRFEREARTLASLEHPNIVAVHDTGVEAGSPYLVMEFVEGVSLRRLLAERRLPPEEALGIVPQLCEALEYAHARGVVHRDVKPENILIDTRGRTKIADFGLAFIVGIDAPRLTRTDVSMGTPHYMAPEQVESSRRVDHRADIYSMGVVLYEMLTGELPLGRFSPPSEKSKVNRRLDEIVLRALEKEPDRRYQQVTEFHRAIESAPQGAGPRRIIRGYEYKSRATLFGWPLVHITKGVDASGREVPARGVIAIGGRAYGVVAIGGFAMGVFPIGGLAIGLVAWGGLAIGALFAMGGGAVGGVAMGGGAAGYYAYGSVGFGRHVYANNRRDPEAAAFFRQSGLFGDGKVDVHRLQGIALDASLPPRERIGALRQLREEEIRSGQRGLRTRAVVESLMPLLESAGAPDRAELCRHLKNALPIQVAATMIEVLRRDPDALVREAAADALEAFRINGAVSQALEHAAEHDVDRRVREQAKASLAGDP